MPTRTQHSALTTLQIQTSPFRDRNLKLCGDSVRSVATSPTLRRHTPPCYIPLRKGSETIFGLLLLGEVDHLHGIAPPPYRSLYSHTANQNDQRIH